jgi:catechol 2,3-dioxygenase-like lactoylglutathione lyase family enzyme
MTSVEFEVLSPILRVANLAASLAYYVDILGFKIDWQHRDVIACVSRGPCSIFLCEGDQGHPGTWVWIGVSDVDALQAEISQRGAIIRIPPTNYPWALEMHVEDPDGNVLRFGSEPRENEPYGEWLDMRGKRWKVE